jgi:hypothetical protein
MADNILKKRFYVCKNPDCKMEGALHQMTTWSNDPAPDCMSCFRQMQEYKQPDNNTWLAIHRPGNKFE